MEQLKYRPKDRLVVPASADTCASCGSGVSATGAEAAEPAYIYALGRIQPRFPSLGIEKEFAQSTGRAETSGLTDRQATQALLANPANRYLVRQLCWVLTIESIETYLLIPHDSNDLDALIEAVRPTPRATDVDVVIGVRGPIAAPQMCNGLMVPTIMFSQVYSFDVDGLISTIPRPATIDAAAFGPAAEEMFLRIMQLADNAGATDEHRTLNYLAVRYPAIYATTAEAFGRNAMLTAVEVRPSRLSGVRKIVDAIFTYTNRETDVAERYFVRVDVTEEFPFLVTRMSPFYER